MEKLNIDKIIISDTKFKDDDYALFEKLKNSISQRGQIRNIVVCETGNKYECIEGSKIIKALKEIGCNEVYAKNMGNLSDEEKNALKIELSKDYFLTNYVEIGKALKSLVHKKDLSQLCNYIPFNLRQAKKLIQLTEFDWDEFSIKQKKLEGQTDMFGMDEVQQKETQEKDPWFDEKLKEREEQKIEQIKKQIEEDEKKVSEVCDKPIIEEKIVEPVAPPSISFEELHKQQEDQEKTRKEQNYSILDNGENLVGKEIIESEEQIEPEPEPIKEYKHEHFLIDCENHLIIHSVDIEEVIMSKIKLISVNEIKKEFPSINEKLSVENVEVNSFRGDMSELHFVECKLTNEYSVQYFVRPVMIWDSLIELVSNEKQVEIEQPKVQLFEPNQVQQEEHKKDDDNEYQNPFQNSLF
jgi:hypothetical protein